MKMPFAAALLCIAAIAGAEPQRGYYRYPALRGDVLVFASEGDLWKAAAAGGRASRLTTHLGEERWPAISEDGATLAFAATYEGPQEVYAMPVGGGLPQRLTWQGRRAMPVGWKGASVLYATEHFSTVPSWQLATVDPATGVHEVLPLAQAADGSFDGTTLFFTRLAFQGSHTRRYKGGTAQNLWRWAPGDAEAVPLTADYAGTSKLPMPWNGRIYFASDRDGTMNIWSADRDGKDSRQHTRHADFEVQEPAHDAGRIAYRSGADLWIYDIAADAATRLDITVDSDFDQQRERWVEKPMEYVTAVHPSPDGKRILLTARGQVFVAPIGHGRLVEATRSPGVRYRSARFLEDGKTLVALSDESDEVELWTLPANGVGEREQLTDDAEILRWDTSPSPDGKYIAHTDKNQRLWLYDVAKKKNRLVEEDRNDTPGLAVWSPDSQWFAYTATAENTFTRIKLFRAKDGHKIEATTERYDSSSPAWSTDGKWLYFLSDRRFESVVRSPWGPRQPEPFFDKTTQIYQLALRKDERSPWQPDDELHAAKDDDDKDDKKDEKKKDKKAKKEVPEVVIDEEGLAARLERVPVAAGNYGNLFATKKRLYFTDRERGERDSAELKMLAIGNKGEKPKTFAEKVEDAELSADGERIMLRFEKEIAVVEADASAPAKIEDEHKASLDGWKFPMLPREEWRQMFADAWRLERDYFYDPKMHGVDWKAVRAKYAPLAERVRTRGELSDAIAQMVAEVSALHTFVRGGDLRKGETDIEPASLGALLARDEKAGGWRVDRIYRGDPDDPDALSPLAKRGVDVQEGDVITAIDGEPTLGAPDPAALLRNKAGKQVLLSVKPKSAKKTRDAIAVPISPASARNLRYDEWELTRREAVDAAAKGDFGYVHLRAMGRDDIGQWARDFFPVFNRKGLIIDVRDNGGGNIDSWILNRLLRKAWFFWQPRTGAPYWNMHYAFRGHVVVLCNQDTASDGEAFAEGFRRLGLGKVIGTRTWGGEIWLSSSNFLADKGIASASEIGVYGPDGIWLIEGHGVEPDIVVDNLPHETFNGRDRQLEAAIEHLQELIRTQPVDVPKPPPYPDKSR